MGGRVDNATYEQVCGCRTGHAEVVQVEYDPSTLTYEELLDLFWKNHDPTMPNRQEPDVGVQYRSAVFFYDAEQEAAAREAKEEFDHSGKFKNKVVTEVTEAGKFWKAEDYHQQYYEKCGLRSTVHY